MRRTDRLFELIQIFRDGRLKLGRDLAEQLGVSLRTLYRDIDTLVASGVPVEGERGVGYMVREQITLRSLRGSEVCVVVLAASQALTTMDMALMRIIAQFENRQIILFVNRIDELSDPINQVPEIRDRIQGTLKQNNIDTNTSIVFGSALWAEAALTGNPDILTEESRETLNTFYLAAGFGDQAASLDKIWALSGLPDLLLAMNERIAEGTGTPSDARTR